MLRGHVEEASVETRYPLLFGYRDLVEGLDFVAGVETAGRALLVEEADEVSVYGVNPGGMAGFGDTRDGALSDFRETYRKVLYDLAAEADTFEEFRTQVEHFVSEASDLDEWEEAVDDVRAGRLEAPEWPTAPAESAVRVTVLLLSIDDDRADAVPPRPDHNRPDTYPQIAA